MKTSFLMSECPHWLEHIHIKYKHSTELDNVGTTSDFTHAIVLRTWPRWMTFQWGGTICMEGAGGGQETLISI